MRSRLACSGLIPVSDKHPIGIDTDSTSLAARRAAALMPNPPDGALLSTDYRSRKVVVIPVMKSDLEDIRAAGLSESIPFNGGMFMLSGSAWVAIEKFISTPQEQELPAVFWVMSAAALFGLLLLATAIPLRHARLRKIDRILSGER